MKIFAFLTEPRFRCDYDYPPYRAHQVQSQRSRVETSFLFNHPGAQIVSLRFTRSSPGNYVSFHIVGERDNRRFERIGTLTETSMGVSFREP